MAVRAAAVAAILSVGAGWLLYVHGWQDTGAKPLAYRDLTGEAAPLQPADPIERLFENSRELSDYFRRAAPHERPPSIDFRREQVLLVSPGPRSSSGYSVHVVRVVEERGRILVDLRERTPTLRNPGRPGVTYPYRLLVFAKRGKPVALTWEGRP